MGCYGALYPCDMTKLYKEIIPLIREGNLARFQIDDRKLSEFVSDPERVKKCGVYFDDEFLNPLPEYDFGTDIQTKENRFEYYYEYCSLVEKMISGFCIPGESELHFGKRSLDSVLFEIESSPYIETITGEVIDKLSGPCFWTHGSGGYNEGIRGWIDETDVAILLDDLDNLRLDYNDRTDEFRNFIKHVHSNNWGILNGGDLRFFSFSR